LYAGKDQLERHKLFRRLKAQFNRSNLRSRELRLSKKLKNPM